MMGEQAELAAKTDGARRRRVTLAVEPDGTLLLTSHVMGAAPEAAWGADDAEVTVRIEADEAARLAFALLVEKLRFQPDAERLLVALCRAHDIDCQVANWT